VQDLWYLWRSKVNAGNAFEKDTPMGSEESLLESPGESTSGIDDLKRIQGISPVIERQLHDVGILTYAQIAALSPEQIARLMKNLPLLSVEHIARQDWPGQARALAPESARIEPSDAGGTLDSYPRYATFTIELLLDSLDQVRRTRIVHAQDGVEENWGGWDEHYLLRFVAARAAIKDPPATAEAAPGAAPKYTGMPDLFAVPPGDVLDTTEPAGLAPDRSPAEARAALPAERSAYQSHAEPQLEIDELIIGEGAPDRQANVWPAAPRVRARLGFRLSGPGAAEVAARALWSTIHIVACDLASGESLVLAAGQEWLIPNQLDYTAALEFALPDDGRYQLVGTVLIAEAQLVGSTLGPVLNVVP
jgi:predicted flap endonuclease-1-like 5' DNA nuclease